MVWSADQLDHTVLVHMVRGPPDCNTSILTGPIHAHADARPDNLYLWPRGSEVPAKDLSAGSGAPIVFAPLPIALIERVHLHRLIVAEGTTVAHEGANRASQVLKLLDCVLARLWLLKSPARAQSLKAIK